jgi:hypothetical protein
MDSGSDACDSSMLIPGENRPEKIPYFLLKEESVE